MVRSEGLDDNLSSRQIPLWWERTRAKLPFLSPISEQVQVTALNNVSIPIPSMFIPSM